MAKPGYKSPRQSEPARQTELQSQTKIVRTLPLNAAFYFSPVSSSPQCCLSQLAHQILQTNIGRARRQERVPTMRLRLTAPLQLSYIYTVSIGKFLPSQGTNDCFLRISDQKSIYCLEFSFTWGRLGIPKWPFHSTLSCFPPKVLDPLCLPVWRHIVTGKSLGSLVQTRDTKVIVERGRGNAKKLPNITIDRLFDRMCVSFGVATICLCKPFWYFVSVIV